METSTIAEIKAKTTLNISDIRIILGSGKNSTYALIERAIKNNLFPVKRVGKKYYVPSEQFWEWFESYD